jgi:Zn-dependent oligopeptidase
MRLALVLPFLTVLACASAPAPAPSTAAAAPAAPAAAAPVAVQAPPALKELPVGGASERVSGPASALTAACKEAIARARVGLDALKAMPAPRDTVTALGWYDDANAVINDLDFQAELARQSSPDAEMRKAGEECDREIQGFATAIYQDRGVYDALSGLDLSGQDAATVWWMKRDLREFRRAGVDRDDATREKVRALNDEIVAIGQEFDRNIRGGTKTVSFTPAELAGLPEDFRKAHPPGADGMVTLTTDYPDYHPFMAYARSSRAREKIWRAYNTRASPANVEVLSRLLAKRYELATVLGYANWADYTTENKMIGSGRAASEFIERITAAAGERSTKELARVLARERKDIPGAKQVPPWDYGYYSDRVKIEQYRFDAKAARPYFEFDRVQRGVLDVSGRLFDVSYRKVEGAKVWHADVEVYDVIAGSSYGERTGQSLGRIYLDLHPRENKYKHAAQYGMISGQAGRRLPESALLCNFPRSGGLMEYDDVRTLFHEFGHLLHHIVGGNTRWAANSGVRNEQDFVEAPSQMLEEWMRDAGVLQTFAREVKTGKPIPAAMVKQLRTADDFGKGVDVRQQMFYAATSLHLYDRDPHGLELTPYVAEIQSRYSPFPYIAGTTFYTAFGHLNGYSAVYYTYMWSKVIAKDLATAFKAKGMFDPATAQRYRKQILEPGGGKPAAELVADFLGRPYDFRAYEAWLREGDAPAPKAPKASASPAARMVK